MKIYRIVFAGFIFLVLSNLLQAQDSLIAETSLPDHPRIMLLKGEEDHIRNMLGSNTMLRSVHNSILGECDSFLDMPPVLQVKIGKRLLDKSRECLRRVFFLSYAARITNEKKYAERAEKELLAVAAFTDWNPSHFLDVAEMTLAVAIGYDWLHDKLSPASADSIKKAILEKGIKPSLEPRNSGWLRNSNNWNQVCNAGMAFGALAIYEDEPELARSVINRAIRTVELPMKEYAPDGGYPEGYNYWGYGTGFNVLMLDAFRRAFNTGFGLAQKNNFLQTAAYMVHMSGSIRQPFNFFDAGVGEDFQPAMFWFAVRLKDPSLLWIEQKHLQNEKSKKYLSERLLPAALIWASGVKMDRIAPPEEKFWVGKGRNPVSLMRSSWSDTAIFVGFKGGSPSSSHAHMDAGSFVMDAEGVRWAMDFGMQEYESLESKGVDLWNMRQNSQRWKVFRYNNYAHNTLTVNDSLQKVGGKAEIISYSSNPSWMNAVVDMQSVYSPLLSKAKRGVALVNNSYVVVRDELTTDTDAVIRWTMATPASVRIIDKKTIEFSKEGKKLYLQVKQPATVTMKTWPTDPVQPYDAPNPGTILAGFEIKVPAKAKMDIEVLLMPGKNRNVVKKPVTQLAAWPK